MTIDCKVEIQNPSKTVYSGQSLRGDVHLSLSEPMKVHSIYIQIVGKEFVYWIAGYGDDKKVNTSENELINHQIGLVSAENGKTN